MMVTFIEHSAPRTLYTFPLILEHPDKSRPSVSPLDRQGARLRQGKEMHLDLHRY